jgi:DNA-binding transcriptional MerR regulator
MKAAILEESIGVKRVARALDLSEHSVRRWANEGKIPSRRDNENRRVFAVADVEKLVAQRRAR